MRKKIVNKESLSPKILEGMTEVSAIVKRTLGPGGLPIIIERVGQALDGSPLLPRITKDGVTVANEAQSDDPEKDIVIQSVKAICRKTNEIAGDGTTTAIVLGESILNETLSALDADPNLNPQLVRESVELAAKDVLAKLKESAIPVKDNDKIRQVATISANGDQEIGDILGEAFDHVGSEGVVTIDEGHSNKNTLDLVEGYQFNRGAEGRDRFFNNKELTRFEAEDARILIYDGKLLNYTHLIPALNYLAGVVNNQPTKKMPPVIILANEFSNEVITFLLVQRANMGFSFCAVKGPHMSNVRTGYYEDIAVVTGGTRLGSGTRSLGNFQEGDEGIVTKAIIDKYKTTFYDALGAEEVVLERASQLRALKEQAESPYDSQVVSERLAALTGGIAKIGVGGSTETEIKEKYDRIEDALNASRAAIQEGIVAGGGATLLRLSDELSPEKSIGHAILARALSAPFFQILENIGLTDENLQSDISEQVIASKCSIYDARERRVVDAFKEGIIDPVKVTRTALENAVSIAALLSTVGGAVIYDHSNK